MNDAMKHLILLRHASAETGEPDRARSLSAQGRSECGRMAGALERLVPGEFRPELLLCSPATRARETLERVGRAFAADVKVEVDEAFYLASASQLVAKLRALAEPNPQVLLVGHNPGLSELLKWLVTHGEAEVLRRAARGLAPGGLAALRIPAPHWRDLAARGAELVAFLRPGDAR